MEKSPMLLLTFTCCTAWRWAITWAFVLILLILFLSICIWVTVLGALRVLPSTWETAWRWTDVSGINLIALRWAVNMGALLNDISRYIHRTHFCTLVCISQYAACLVLASQVRTQSPYFPVTRLIVINPISTNINGSNAHLGSVVYTYSGLDTHPSPFTELHPYVYLSPVYVIYA